MYSIFLQHLTKRFLVPNHLTLIIIRKNQPPSYYYCCLNNIHKAHNYLQRSLYHARKKFWIWFGWVRRIDRRPPRKWTSEAHALTQFLSSPLSRRTWKTARQRYVCLFILIHVCSVCIFCNFWFCCLLLFLYVFCPLINFYTCVQARGSFYKYIS